MKAAGKNTRTEAHAFVLTPAIMEGRKERNFQPLSLVPYVENYAGGSLGFG